MSRSLITQTVHLAGIPSELTASIPGSEIYSARKSEPVSAGNSGAVQYALSVTWEKTPEPAQAVHIATWKTIPQTLRGYGINE